MVLRLRRNVVLHLPSVSPSTYEDGIVNSKRALEIGFKPVNRRRNCVVASPSGLAVVVVVLLMTKYRLLLPRADRYVRLNRHH